MSLPPASAEEGEPRGAPSCDSPRPSPPCRVEIKGEDEGAREVASQPDGEEIEDVLERGRLTHEEKMAVMLDLRPMPVNSYTFAG